MDTLKSMFGFGASNGSVDRGIYRYVRCDRCKDVVRVRISMANEVSEISEEPDEDGAGDLPTNPAARYIVTKGVVDTKCFRPMRLTILFDGRRNELESHVRGGEVVDQAAWEELRSSRQQPAQPSE
jgi:hypothetical protein